MAILRILVVCVFFAVLFLAGAQAGKVEFWKENFTMSCPENGTWYYKENRLETKGKTLGLKYDNNVKGLYRCEYEGIKYYFYVQGKVCENCFELDAKLFGTAIVVDMVLTVFVMVITYWYTKKRRGAAFPHTSKAAVHPGGRAPPVPSPDYERLNPHTLSQGTYSEVKMNRM